MAATPQTPTALSGKIRSDIRWLDEISKITARALQAYSILLNLVTSFKYLGWIMMTSDEDWPRVVGNLQKARNIWARLLRMLGREEANLRVSGIFQGAGAVGTAFLVEYVGDDPLHVPGTGGVSAQGIHTAH